MTNEKAIEILKEYIECKGTDIMPTNEDVVAFELAIKALENEPKKCELTNKQIDKIVDLLETEWGYNGIKEDVKRIITEATT